MNIDAYKSDLYFFVLDPKSGKFRIAPAPWMPKFGDGKAHGFGHLDRHGFVALYAAEGGAVLQVGREGHQLTDIPEVHRSVHGRHARMTVSLKGATLLDVRYRTAASRWPYSGGQQLDPEVEEEEDFYFWLARKLSPEGIMFVQDHYAKGWH